MRIAQQYDCLAFNINTKTVILNTNKNNAGSQNIKKQ